MLRNIICLLIISLFLFVVACLKRIDLVERNFHLYHGTGFTKGGRPIEARMSRPDANFIKSPQMMRSPPPLPSHFVPNHLRIPNSSHVMNLQSSQQKKIEVKSIESPAKVEFSTDSEYYPNPYHEPIETKKMDNMNYESPIGPPNL